MTMEGEEEIKMTMEGEEEIKIQEGDEEETKQKEKIKMTQEGEEEEMIQEREKETLKAKSLASQLKHMRDKCHEGIISKFNTKKYFTGEVLEVAQQIEKQIVSQLPTMLQESTDKIFKEAGVGDALLKLEELRAKKCDPNKLPWRFSSVPKDDAKRLLLSEEHKSLQERRELADQVQLDIQELRTILRQKQEELQKLEQEINDEMASISKPVQLTVDSSITKIST